MFLQIALAVILEPTFFLIDWFFTLFVVEVGGVTALSKTVCIRAGETSQGFYHFSSCKVGTFQARTLLPLLLPSIKDYIYHKII